MKLSAYEVLQETIEKKNTSWHVMDQYLIKSKTLMVFTWNA